MLLITTIETLTSLDEDDLRTLANYRQTDRIIVLARNDASVPITLFNALTTLKCPFTMTECNTKSGFALGYMIGKLTSSAKSGEKVTILAKGAEKMNESDKNVIWAETLAQSKPVPAKVILPPSKGSSQPSRAKGSSVAVKTEPVQKTEKTAKKPAAKSTGKTEKADIIESLMAEYPSLKKHKKLLTDNREAFIEAVTSAADAEITFKFQLQIRFGEEGVEVWDIINGSFDKLKKECK